MLMNAPPGQALSEYCLIGALIAVTSITALTMLGSNLSLSIDSMLSAPPKVSKEANPSLAPNSSDTGFLNPGPSNGITIILQSGRTLHLDNYPMNVAKSVQTAGVNGATRIMADNIISIAHQLVQSGEISPVQESQLISLANQAHTLAEIEKMAESTLQKNLDKTTLMTTSVTFNNTTYTHIGDLVNEIGILDDFQTAGGQLANFNTLLAQINSSGAIADPVLNQLVNGLASNVQNLADQTENTFWDVTNNGLSPSAFSSTVASKTTTEDAASICTTGQGTDNGISCT
ncbi:MAG: hypothetical protein K0Q74_1415 [Gammaproteobacteria bacterium]|jgi:hypothetical protein|nr:hypothetical protein [Gammaproteobacteria bacterium]